MAHLAKVKISNENWKNSDSDLIVVGVYEDKTLSPMAKSIDENNGKVLVNCKFHDDKQKWEPINISLGKRPSLTSEFMVVSVCG